MINNVKTYTKEFQKITDYNYKQFMANNRNLKIIVNTIPTLL